MIDIKNIPAGARCIELGGGENPRFRPNVDVRPCTDANGNGTVDFTANFEEPLPISSDEWDLVYSHFAIEHISWRKVPQFLAEVFRITKPGGAVVMAMPDTLAQMHWTLQHLDGWDGHDLFESASCVLYGDQTYSDNAHKAYFDNRSAHKLFHAAGFTDIDIRAYGERKTDMLVTARKPATAIMQEEEAMRMIQATQHKPGFVGVTKPLVAKNAITPGLLASDSKPAILNMTREEMFDKHYFNGGGKVGGYAREGFRDFPVHDITFRHVMMRNPKSVLEVGAGRGYVGKRLQDAGCTYMGLEISKHAHMTRVCDPIVNMDVCKTPWGDIPTEPFDLSFSMAMLEHIPEEFVVLLLRELGKHCKRHLHGIDFGGQDDGFDKTHCTLKDAGWWDAKFKEAGLTDYEIVNKEDLQKWHSGYPEAVHKDDGKRKLNIGSFTSMFRHNWINVDIHDLAEFARQNYCHYLRHDCRQVLPYDTGSVDLIFAHHFLEHLTPDEASKFLKECRRLLKPDSGAMRIVVPDAHYLMHLYINDPAGLDVYQHINDGVEQAKTYMGKLNALLHAGHQSFYDQHQLAEILTDAGFVPKISAFRVAPSDMTQILQETTEMDFGGISLFMNARCKTA